MSQDNQTPTPVATAETTPAAETAEAKSPAEKFKQYCQDNPDATECRIYED